MNIESFCILIIYMNMNRIKMMITRISDPKTYHQTGNRRQKKGKAGRSKPKKQTKDWSVVWTDTCMFTNLQQQYIWWWPATVPSPLKEREREIYFRIHVCRDWYTSGLQQTLDSFHALDYGKESKVFFEPTSEHPCRATNYWLKQSKAMQGRTYCN